MKRIVYFGVGVALGTQGVAVAAQDVAAASPQVDSIFARNRSVAVADRVIPGYDRMGMDVGIFNVRPEVVISGFSSDNLYATDSDKVSDEALVVAPTLNVVADLRNTKFSLGATAQFSRFASRISENNTTYQSRATLQHDFGSQFTLNVEARYQRRAEQRSDPGAVDSSIIPILFNVALAGASLQWEGTRLRLVGSGSFSNVTYMNGITFDGSELSQRYRDRNVVRFGGLADYAIDADFAFRGQVNFVKSDFKRPDLLDFLDRSTSRVEVLGGASFEFTDLLRGEAGIGYITERFTKNSFRGFSGFGGRGQIEYLISPLTTFTLKVSRTIEEAGLPESPTFVRTMASLSVDHELYRNFIISGYGGYSTNRFQTPSRHDARPTVGAAVKYSLNRNVSVIAKYDYLNASSSPLGALRSFSLNTVSLGIDLGL